MSPAPDVPAAPASLIDSAGERATSPPVRRLRGYAFDPSLSIQMDTALVNEVVFRVPWEGADVLEPGPVGEYVEVVDCDPASGCFYPPVNLNNPHLLAQDGLAPSEGNPQFHQQMVYAVSMTTIRNFERALGRRALWSPHGPESSPRGGTEGDPYVQRLRIYPHALREANAYYSPKKKALLFGYFPATAAQLGEHLPGGTVFTCLSHDIVAHETTHALLDGMHRRYVEPTHPDALAFHEAFADIVALFQHFTFPEVLRHQIAQTRGDLASQNRLGELAQQFGRAIGHYGALRDAIGAVDPVTRMWEPRVPDPRDYDTVMEPHQRGAILVAAVFDAFLAIYRTRVADLFRIATSGTGVLPAGAVHPDLVNRLAGEAAKTAQHVLTMCIRALDYCPPVDITFGDYLRAIITADMDLVPEDDLGYRVAFIESFRRRGIYPLDVRTLSVDSLRWDRAPETTRTAFHPIAAKLRNFIHQSRYIQSRRETYRQSYEIRRRLHSLIAADSDDGGFGQVTGLALGAGVALPGLTPDASGRPLFEVHALRPAQRVGPDGEALNQVIVSITQHRTLGLDGKAVHNVGDETITFRGGSTLILDLDTLSLRYAIVKRIDSEQRLRRQLAYRQTTLGQSLYATYFSSEMMHEHEEPFAFLHRQS